MAFVTCQIPVDTGFLVGINAVTMAPCAGPSFVLPGPLIGLGCHGVMQCLLLFAVRHQQTSTCMMMQTISPAITMLLHV